MFSKGGEEFGRSLAMKRCLHMKACTVHIKNQNVLTRCTCNLHVCEEKKRDNVEFTDLMLKSPLDIFVEI